MEPKFLKDLYASFAKLVDEYGFTKVDEFMDERDYTVDYCSSVFCIKLEKYGREFYETLYKPGFPAQIGPDNLLRFLNIRYPEFKYFHGKFSKASDFEAYYRKQFEHISTTIYENFATINDFFARDDFAHKAAELREFVIKSNPQRFKRISDGET